MLEDIISKQKEDVFKLKDVLKTVAEEIQEMEENKADSLLGLFTNLEKAVSKLAENQEKTAEAVRNLKDPEKIKEVRVTNPTEEVSVRKPSWFKLDFSSVLGAFNGLGIKLENKMDLLEQQGTIKKAVLVDKDGRPISLDALIAPYFERLINALQNKKPDVKLGGHGGPSIKRETPTGAINGSNTTFTLSQTPANETDGASSLELYLGGVLQQPGGVDYTISGTSITLNNAPDNTTIFAIYKL